MYYLFDNLWVWTTAALFVCAVGGAKYSMDQTWNTLLTTFGIAAGVFGIGLLLYVAVDTPRKSIKRMMDGLVVSLVADDLEKVLSHISPTATETQEQARANLRMVKLSSVNYFGFHIVELHWDGKPLPLAKIEFVAMVNGRSRIGGMFAGYDGPFGPTRVEFRVGLERGADQKWRITDDCEFSPTAFDHP